MKKNSVNWIGCMIAGALLMISCTTTEITQKKMDESFKGKPVSDILVIAITGNEHTRQIFEKQFVAHLNSVGVEAISSAEMIQMPADLELKKETILEAVQHHHNDAVIITHLIGKEEKDIYTRGDAARRGFYGFYSSRYTYTHEPGYASTDTTVRLETNLYDVETEKLIWSGQSKTMSHDAREQIIDDVIQTVVASLQKEALIAPK